MIFLKLSIPEIKVLLKTIFVALNKEFVKQLREKGLIKELMFVLAKMQVWLEKYDHK